MLFLFNVFSWISWLTASNEKFNSLQLHFLTCFFIFILSLRIWHFVCCFPAMFSTEFHGSQPPMKNSTASNHIFNLFLHLHTFTSYLTFRMLFPFNIFSWIPWLRASNEKFNSLQLHFLICFFIFILSLRIWHFACCFPSTFSAEFHGSQPPIKTSTASYRIFLFVSSPSYFHFVFDIAHAVSLQCFQLNFMAHSLQWKIQQPLITFFNLFLHLHIFTSYLTFCMLFPFNVFGWISWLTASNETFNSLQLHFVICFFIFILSCRIWHFACCFPSTFSSEFHGSQPPMKHSTASNCIF